MHLRRLIARIVHAVGVGVVAATVAAAPVEAHDGSIGSSGPFRVDVAQDFDRSFEPRWGHGELELHVPGGTEVVALGASGEPMAKLDGDGNMFKNENSATWSASHDAAVVPGPAGDVSWVWVQGGGSLQYRDQRILYTDAGLPEGTPANGGTVREFELEFTVDGVPFTAVGAIVFDPDLDPAGADVLLGAPRLTAPTAAEPELSPDPMPVPEPAQPLEFDDTVSGADARDVDVTVTGDDSAAGGAEEVAAKAQADAGAGGAGSGSVLVAALLLSAACAVAVGGAVVLRRARS
jgi:hypothetical protein